MAPFKKESAPLDRPAVTAFVPDNGISHLIYVIRWEIPRSGTKADDRDDLCYLFVGHNT